MQAGETTVAAEQLLSLYREVLLIDPFYKITVETGDGGFASECRQDGGLAWTLRLNPVRHADLTDVKYSVLDGLLRVIFAATDRATNKDPLYMEAREEVLVRLVTVFSSLLPDEDGSQDGPEEAEES